MLDRPSMAPAIAEQGARYAVPDLGRSLWQVANTFVPYVACWAAARTATAPW